MNEYEKWSVIVDDFTKYRTAKEVTIQRLWEEYFLDPDIFGFSVRKGEIDIHRVMRIGSKERTIPDIIIHDSDSGKDLFIIELKQYNLAFDGNYEEQLLSYMRLFRLDIGILICSEIRVYCLDEYGEHSSEPLVIRFNTDDRDGCELMSFLTKGSFNKNKIKNYISEAVKRKIVLSPEEPKEKDEFKKTDSSEVYAEPVFKYVLIKIRENTISEKGSLYEAVRRAWKASDRICGYRYVFAVVGGVVRGVFIARQWREVTNGVDAGRYEFFGESAPDEIAREYVGKHIPPCYSKQGSSNPVQYGPKRER